MTEHREGSELFNWNALGPRIFYLLLGLPLGIAYFTFTIVLLALGLGTLVIAIGIPILLFLFVGSSSLLSWERGLNHTLLGVEIPVGTRENQPEGVLKRLLFHAGRVESWSRLLYMILKLPFGILSFVLTLVAMILPFAFSVAAFASLFLTALPVELGWGRTIYLDPLSGAAILGLLAVVAGFLGLLIVFGLSKFWEIFNSLMLAPHTVVPTSPPQGGSAVVIP